MLTLEQIEERYLAHSGLYNKLTEFIKSKNLDNDFPTFFEVTSELSLKQDELLKALVVLGKQDNLYACYIIYRTLLEHFYRSFFLIGNLAKEKSDVTAEHYKVHYFTSEFLAEQMGHLEMDDINNEVELKTDFVDYIRNKFEGFKEFDKANQKEISEAIKKFNLKAIVKYLHTYFSEGKTDKTVANFFAKILPEYSMTSTFVHGGPYGTIILNRFKTPEERKKEIQRIVGVGFSASCVAKENILFSFNLGADAMITTLEAFRKLRDPNFKNAL